MGTVPTGSFASGFTGTFLTTFFTTTVFFGCPDTLGSSLCPLLPAIGVPFVVGVGLAGVSLVAFALGVVGTEVVLGVLGVFGTSVTFGAELLVDL